MFVVFDKDGAVRAVSDENHIAAPEGGKVVEASEAEVEAALAVMAKPKLAVKAGPLPVTAESLKKLRQEKMRAIGNASVAGRGRVFTEFPHVHLMDQHRHIDVMVMYMRGKLNDGDEIWTRNLKSGEYDIVKVGALLDEIEKTFRLRQELRKHDQAYRNKINAIFYDKTKSHDVKCAEISALEVPEFLGVDEKKSSQAVVLKG